ncbi:MAG: hypothetical protein P8Y37_04110 [Anaerolineales bacterium]|jgi:uncharacterized membrane protein YeaQ/YmgE (transglycosylase-associated protein family)
MQIVILIAAMILVGLLMGFLAGLIWKDNRPIGTNGDYLAAVLTAVAVGLLDWFVIPAMGFSTTMKWLGVALEPAASALIVLWIIRKAKE